MKRPVLFSLVAMLAASTTAAVYFYRENVRLRLALEGVAPMVAQAVDDAPVAVPTDSEDASQSGTSDSANIAAGPEQTEREERRANFRAQRGGDRRERGQETRARMLTDPAMREVMLTRMKSQVDRQFGDLFVSLGLNEDQAEMLRTLLAEQQMARTQSNFLQRASSDDEQARLEAENWQQRELATIEAGIKEVLGPDGMEILSDYQSTASERQQVANISQRASYMGAPLDGPTSDKLVDVILAAEESNPVSRNPGTSRRGGPAEPLTQQAASQYLGELQAQNQAVLADAQKFLAPSQLEALAAQHLEQFEQASAQLDFQLRNPDLNTGGGDFRGGGGPGFGGRGGGQGGR